MTLAILVATLAHEYLNPSSQRVAHAADGYLAFILVISFRHFS